MADRAEPWDTIIADKHTKYAKLMIFTASDAPLSLDLLVLPDVSLLSLAAVMEPLRGANRVAGRRLFRWRLLSPDGATPGRSTGAR